MAQTTPDSASDLALARVLFVVAVVVIACYFAVHSLGRSKLAIVLLLLVAIFLILAGRWLWRTRRAALDASARQREAAFYLTTVPKRAADLSRDLGQDDRAK